MYKKCYSKKEFISSVSKNEEELTESIKKKHESFKTKLFYDDYVSFIEDYHVCIIAPELQEEYYDKCKVECRFCAKYGDILIMNKLELLTQINDILTKRSNNGNIYSFNEIHEMSKILSTKQIISMLNVIKKDLPDEDIIPITPWGFPEGSKVFECEINDNYLPEINFTLQNKTK